MLTPKKLHNTLFSSLFYTLTPVQAAELPLNARLEEKLETLTITAKTVSMDQLDDIRSIATFDQDDFEKHQAERIEDIAAYSPGIIGSSQTAGTETSLFIRGYRTDNGNVFVNGLQDNKRLFSRDLDTVERVDIIKGHSSVLFGSGSPGGTIHYTTKSPQQQNSTSLKSTLGSYQKRRLVFDSTGNTGINNVNYRFVAIGQDANSFMDNVGNDKQVLLGSLAWNYGSNNQLRLEVEYDRLQNPYSYGIVRVNNEILYDQSYVDPRAKSDRRYLRSSAYWQHAINQNWGLNTSVNYSTLDRNDIMMGFYYKLNESTLLGHWADSDNDFWQLSGKMELSGEVNALDMAHNLTIGLEYNKSDNHLYMLRSTAFTLDPYTPSFDRPEPRDSAVVRGFHYQDKDKNIYLVDKIQLNDQLSLTAGLRYSEFYNLNRQTNTVAVDQDTIASTLGLSWQLNQHTTLYSSYAKSFEPNTGISKEGNYFEPKEAEQLEFGLRWSPMDDLSMHIATYELKQKNLLTTDPLDKDYAISAGEQRTRGVEIEAIVDLNSDLQLKAAYSHLKNKVTEDFKGLLGKTASGIPRNMGSLRLSWQPNTVRGLNSYIGLIAVGKRYGDANNSFSVSGYGRIDAGLSYQWQQAIFRLTVENLLDKRYVAAPFYEDDIYQGKRRDISASVSFSW